MATINEIATKAIELDREIKARNAELAKLKSQLAEAKDELLDLMKETGTKAIKLDIGSVSSARLLSASIEDEAEFRRWIDKTGAMAVDFMAWDRKAIREFMVEHIDNGEELPPGIKGFEGVSLRFQHPKTEV